MKIAVILALLVLFNTNCKNNDSVNSSNDSSVIMDLKVGNQWAYEFKAFDSVGTVQFTDTLVYKIVRDTTINSIKWFFIGNDSYAIELLTNKSDGLWYMRISDDGIPGQSAVLIAKYPGSVNDSWLTTDSSTAKLIAKEVGVSIPLGNFSCYHYSITEKHAQYSSQSVYFPIGKTYIRNDRFYKIGSGQVYLESRSELIRLSLKKQSASSQRHHRNKILFIAG